MAFGQSTSAPPEPGAAQAADPKSVLLKSADLETDLAVLRRAYEELHPGLHRYNSKTAMDAKFGELQREFAHDLSLQEAYVDLSVFAAEVKCGHTYPNFFNQKKTIAGAF